MTGDPSEGSIPHDPTRYRVVARRYRPQSFTDLVGQQAAAQALKNAITTERVGHAYLFTGARGVGKTSTARIFAKALNCVQGPTSEPCQVCDMCRGISEGHDVDVLEIDGASNRGIDEIRQLRSSVGVRPSRAKFKLYIIDEVHMLTREAFNALLKTLEEPPAHVKFLFCTTAPDKIPITVLSRCQRFDFPPVEMSDIVGRLAEIVTQEGATAEAAALEVLARRAAGSLRDSQSLLEQVLAFCGNEVTEARVHEMLGTASSQRVLALLDTLTEGDAAHAIQQLDEAIRQGVDAGQFAEQLLGQLRDVLTVAVGGEAELLLHSSRQELETLGRIAAAWGTETLLAAAQIVDQALVRMRQSLHSRTLLELALVRLARLDQLHSLSDLLLRMRGDGGPPSASAAAPAARDKKKTERHDPPRAELPPPHHRGQSLSRPVDPPLVASKSIASSAPRSASLAPDSESLAETGDRPARGKSVVASVPTAEAAGIPGTAGAMAAEPWNDAEAERVWRDALDSLQGVTADFARKFSSVATFAPNRLVVRFPVHYNSHKTFCERAEKRSELEAALRTAAGRAIRLEFELATQGEEEQPASTQTRGARPSPSQARREYTNHTFVKQAMDLFAAEIAQIDLPREK